MLVLSRKKQESIRIGDEIEVVVLEIAKNRVRLGFRCPDHISITREELQQFSREVVLNLPAAGLLQENAAQKADAELALV